MSEKQYIASLSYGKDSVAMLHVIRDVLDLPLDRIITADVWATDTIPADLPPMVEFKEYADKEIKRRWGIDVEHLCAMRSFQNPPVTQGGGAVKKHTKIYSTRKFSPKLENGQPEETRTSVQNAETQKHQINIYTDSHASSERGATVDSKFLHSMQLKKKSYQDLFYTVRKKGNRAGQIIGFPLTGGVVSIGQQCNTDLKMKPIRDFIKT